MEAENRHQSAAGTTPALDYINGLPPELLLMVFDYFDFRMRQTISEVCQRWSEILSNYPSIDEPGWLFQDHLRLGASESKIRKYRSVWISQLPNITIDMFQDYLFNEDLVENLVELYIDQTLYKFEGKTEMRLPNLRTLRIAYKRERLFKGLPPLRCKIIAPKLRTFYQTCSAIREPLHMYSEQIETLVIDNLWRTEMLSVMGNLLFANVRSLTLDVSSGSFRNKDLHVELRALLGRLNYLELCGSGTFDSILSFIIGEANNLKSLKIYKQKIDKNVLLQINKLKRLEAITLIQRHGDGTVTRGLSLPNVIKLVANIGSLENLPCLRSLDLRNSEEPTYIAFFRPVANQLESLCMSGTAFLNRNCIDGICSLVNLSTLKMSIIVGETPEFEELFRRLNRLKDVTFSECRLKTASSSITYDNFVRYVGRQTEKSTNERFRKYFEELSSRYVDCVMIAKYGFLWD